VGNEDDLFSGSMNNENKQLLFFPPENLKEYIHGSSTTGVLISQKKS